MSSFFYYGPPGTGKTTLLSSFTKLGYHVHIIDIDRKVPTMKNLEPMLKNGSLTYTMLEASFLDSPLTARVKMGPKALIVKMPKGYTEMTEIVDEFQEGKLPDCLKDIDSAKIVLGLDGMTRTSQHMRRLLRYFKKGQDATFHDWDFVKLNYEELFDALYNLQPKPFAHVVITAHAMDEKDDVVGVITTKPMLDGSTRDGASGFVEECYFLSCKVQGTSAKFLCQTKPSGRIRQARSSRDLPVYTEADMSVMLEGERYAPSTNQE